MMANQRNLDIIGNNLLNSETAGYRAERALYSAFELQMMSVTDQSGQKLLGDGKGYPIVTVEGEKTLFEPGPVENTDRSLDVAITGDGFFNVTGEDGKSYLTRNGSFDLDTEGYLVLPGIGRVMGTNGYIKAMRSDVTIGPDGTVMSAQGTSLGKIKISEPPDYSTLARTETGMFTTDAATPDSTNFSLVQKSLEQSNVNTNVEYLNLIAIQRAFQSCSSALSTVDSINRKAAQQLAAV